MAESFLTVPFSQVAGWVKQWVESWFLRKIGTNTYTGDLDITGTLDITGAFSAATVTATTEVITPIVRASGAAGLRLEDDGDNLGIFIEDGGLVSIRGTNPAVELDVTGTAAVSTEVITPIVRATGAGGLRLEDDGDNLGLFVADGGKVYFTNAPGVRTYPANGYIHQETVTTADTNLALWHNADDTAGPTLILGKSRGTAVGSNIIVQNGDALGGIMWYGGDGTDATPTSSPGAAIIAVVDGTPGNNDVPTAITFHTRQDGVDIGERMRIDDAGNVGFGGIPSTSHRLQVFGSAAKATAATTNVASFGTSDAAASNLQLLVQSVGSPTAGSRYMILESVEQGTAYRNLVINPSGGNVGIGVTPSYNFHLLAADPVVVIQDSSASMADANVQLWLRESSSGGAAQGGFGLKFVNDVGYISVISDTTAVETNAIMVQEAGRIGLKITPHATYEVNVGSSDAASALYINGNTYSTANISALSFTDRTKFFDGDALAALAGVKGKKGEIDHSTLPEFARSADGTERDLGAMISLLTVAVQQLDRRLTALEKA